VANKEDVKRLKRGVVEWNVWRIESGAHLIRVDLRGADVTGADLSFANLTGVDLSGALLIRADLSRADVGDGAILIGAGLHHAILTGADLSSAHLIRADLTGADLSSADLTKADLSDAKLIGADLTEAHLSGAKLIGADLTKADLSGTKLIGADLTGADLSKADLRNAHLSGANLTHAVLHETIFGNVDLTGVIGLETCTHRGPSTIDHRTLQISELLPLPFLRGVGLPDRLIDYLPSLFDQAIQYFSCFISYSAKDQDFAERFHADLQNKALRCWFAPHDLRIGDKFLDKIDAAIRLRDKVLLILSEHSIKSDWVEAEVMTAFEEERKREQTVLFPIRLDNAVMDTNKAWASMLRTQRHIGDFRRWKDHDGYKGSFERVLRDLATPTKNT
jgi:uncharacterized protein YjbI with pentapeptide repeats